MSTERWYWIDTGWACGGLVVKEGKVVDSAPIFRKFRGQTITHLAQHYSVVALRGEEEP